jgi:hypothetical protein
MSSTFSETMPKNQPLEATIRDIDRLLDWYQLRLRADRHLDARTILRYRDEIARLETLRAHLHRRLYK